MIVSKFVSSYTYKAIFNVSVIIAFFIVHFNNEITIKMLEAAYIIEAFSYIPFAANTSFLVDVAVIPLKRIALVVALLVIVLPLFQNFKINENFKIEFTNKNNAFLFTIIGILVVPLYLKSMGLGYAVFSSAPFESIPEGINSVWYYKRLLMPFLGNTFFLSGMMYFFLTIVLTYIFLVLVKTFFVENNTYLPNYKLISIFTSSFFIFQFQYPGYPDILVFVFLLISVTFKTSDKEKISLYILALLTHEISIFVSIVLALFSLRKPNFIYFILLIFCYVFIWLLSIDFNLDLLMSANQINNIDYINWIYEQPFLELYGVFFANKLLWILVIWALAILFIKREYKKIMFVIFIVLSSIIMTFIAVDTTRLIGWSFIALLFCVVAVEKYYTKNNIINYIYIINLIVPSYYVGLNTGIVSSYGLYYLLTKIISA